RKKTCNRSGFFRPMVQQLEERVVPAPIAHDDTMYAISGKPVPLNVLFNDVAQGSPINPATVTITVNASNGTTAVIPLTSAVIYTGNAGFTGTDTFKYTVKDTGGAVSNQATVTVTSRASVLLPGFDTTTFPPNDDGTYPTPQSLGFTIDFFGLTFTQA